MLFAIEADEIRIYVGKTRWLGIADGDQRELQASIGRALGNLLIASEHFGSGCHVTLLPDTSCQRLLVQVRLTGGGKTPPFRPSRLFETIRKRRTNRGVNQDSPIPAEELARLRVCYVEEDQYELPDARSFFELFETVGWNRRDGLDESALLEVISASWTVIPTRVGDLLVGCGRFIFDGILHAFVVDLIVRPAFQERGPGGQFMRFMGYRFCRHHIRDIRISCAHGKAGFCERFDFVSPPQDAPGMGWKPN